MQENVRSHDHRTTDQGARIGLLGAAPNNTGSTTSLTLGAVYATSVAVTIPAGLPASATILVIASCRASQTAAASWPLGAVFRGAAGSGVAIGPELRTTNPTNGTGGIMVAMGSEPAPAAGTYTYGLAMRGEAAGTVTWTGTSLFVILL